MLQTGDVIGTPSNMVLILFQKKAQSADNGIQGVMIVQPLDDNCTQVPSDFPLECANRRESRGKWSEKAETIKDEEARQPPSTAHVV